MRRGTVQSFVGLDKNGQQVNLTKYNEDMCKDAKRMLRYIRLKAYYGDCLHDAEDAYCITPDTFYWHWERLNWNIKESYGFSYFSLAIVFLSCNGRIQMSD